MVSFEGYIIFLLGAELGRYLLFTVTIRMQTLHLSFVKAQQCFGRSQAGVGGAYIAELPQTSLIHDNDFLAGGSMLEEGDFSWVAKRF